MNLPVHIANHHLSTDPEVGASQESDPDALRCASVKLASDTLPAGAYLLAEGHKHWPSTLPLMITHGTDDFICSPSASRQFFDQVRLPQNDKVYISYEGSYHEIHNEPKFWKKNVDDMIQFIKARLILNRARL
ncbi:hypothetical protein FRB93_011266 [Tulasnella sp. JGI-2019a]|nr:hypothetical protein FRB93_011266 [Tulasnella sp. JGI-2019a]